MTRFLEESRAPAPLKSSSSQDAPDFTASTFPAATHKPSRDPDAAFARWVESRRTPLLAVTILFALMWCVVLLQFTVDDAFINFRYAENLVAHHVWNWNPSGNREEAYTSFIYVVLGILPKLLHLSPALFLKFAGLAWAGLIVRRLGKLAPVFSLLLGILVLAMDPYLWMQVFSGLETPLYMLLIVEMALCVPRAQTVAAPWVYLIFLLLPLTRPEGIVFACAGVALFWLARGSAPKRLGHFAGSASLGISYFLARWRYFHHLLPNPYYAKVHFGTWRGFLRGFIGNVGASSAYFFILLLLFLLARKPVTRVFAACSFLLLLILFAPNSMPTNFGDRFYLQLTFPIFVVFLIIEDCIRISRIVAIVAGIFFLAVSPGAVLEEATYFPILRRAHIDLGRHLAPFAQGHTLFTGEAGAIPYYSNWVTYDFMGLGTNRLSREALTVSKLERIHPDLILLFANSPGPEGAEETARAGPWAANPIFLQYINRSGQYEYAGASRCHDYYLVEFLKKDTMQHDLILAALRRNTVTSASIEPSVKALLLQQYVPWSP